jgi:hypothetical protein
MGLFLPFLLPFLPLRFPVLLAASNVIVQFTTAEWRKGMGGCESLPLREFHFDSPKKFPGKGCRKLRC